MLPWEHKYDFARTFHGDVLMYKYVHIFSYWMTAPHCGSSLPRSLQAARRRVLLPASGRLDSMDGWGGLLLSIGESKSRGTVGIGVDGLKTFESPRGIGNFDHAKQVLERDGIIARSARL
jgi:hypothetical protein